MESEAKYTFVGIAVIILTCLTVGFGLWLGANTSRHTKAYSIYFKKHTLGGLQINSDVTMRGIKVGSVTSLQISAKNIEQVRVDILLNAETPVKTDTVALINRNFLTGFASIDLARGTQNAENLTNRPPGEQHPVIPEARTELEEMADSLPEALEKFSELTSRVRSVLSEENVQAVSSIIKNVNEVSAEFSKNKERIDTIFNRLESAMGEFSKISRTLDTFTSENTGRIKEISGELIDSLKKFRDTISSFDERSTKLLTSLTGTSEVLSQQAVSTSQSVSETAETAASTFESFSEPRKIITGPHKTALGPGEGAFK